MTNDQYTAEKCDNRTILDEPKLLAELKKYFSSLIEDKTAFVSNILSTLDKQVPEASNPELIKKEIDIRRKKLLSKKDRYQEMYANDLITMVELKEKLSAIAQDLKTIDHDFEQIAQAAQIASNTEQVVQYYRQEILRFLELESVTNIDMRRIIDHITVSKDGVVQVVLKKIENIAVV